METLAAMGNQTYLLDLSRFPREMRMNVTYGRNNDQSYRLIDDRDGSLDLSKVNAIWWRRPQPFVIDPEITSPVNQSFAQAESFSAWAGLWLCADAGWMNHPTADDEASRKVYQLKIAQEVGLEIPTTIITNDPEAARDFIQQTGPITRFTRRSQEPSTHGGRLACLLPTRLSYYRQSLTHRSSSKNTSPRRWIWVSR